ncbi:MAG: acyltransferase family protein [Agathobacter sp.]
MWRNIKFKGPNIALPWFSLGNYIAYNEKFRTKFSNGTLAGLAFGSLIFGLFFRLCDLPLDLSEIGIMICATSLFLLAINNPSVSIHKEIEKLGDTYSLYVYIIHIFVSGVIGTCAQMFHQENTLWYAWLKPLIVLIVSIIGSIVIHHLVVKIKQILYPAK